MKRLPRPYRREPRALLILLACALVVIWRVFTVEHVPTGPELLEEGIYEVRRVVDGDTLLLTSGARVRLQGIDSPETVREGFEVEEWGPEASRFTKQFIASADNHVRLTFGLERKDRHDRFLAFVWHGERMLNEELVRAGLAHARLGYRYSGQMKRRLERAQDEARRARRGLWSRRAESGEPRAESRERRAESGEPRAESRERRAESGERRAKSREPDRYSLLALSSST